MVIGQYTKASLDNGCWMVGVSKVEEYDEFPDWKIEAGYCAGVEYSRSLLSRFRTALLNLSGTKTE